MPDDDFVNLRKRDNDALARMYSAFKSQQPDEGEGGAGGRFDVGDELIAVITSTDGCGIGYYVVALYQPDPLLFDPSVDMTTAKLGSGSAPSKLPISGYGFNFDEVGASDHLLDVGQVFNCKVKGSAKDDGKAMVALIGNAIGQGCDE